jgi:hypothetical protein
LWDDLAPQFRAAVASFRLDEPTKAYVAPDFEPWKFWG